MAKMNRAARLSLLAASVSCLAAGIETARAQDNAGSASSIETILVSGKRRVDGAGMIQVQVAPKNASVVTEEFIKNQPAAANVLQLVNLLPGVNANDRDPTGTGRTALSLRGFQSNQIGLMLDGVPVNDSGTFNVFAQEYVDAENLASIYIQQGAGDADTPNVGASGGNIGMITKRPSDDFHISFNQAFGDYSFRRSFIRLDTGTFNEGKTKAFVSYSNAVVDVWRGKGTTDRDHVDALIQHSLSEGSRLSFAAYYNTAETYSYQGLTKAQIAQYGYNFNFAPTFLPIPAAVPGKADSDNNSANLNGNTLLQRSNFYPLLSNPFENFVAVAKANLELTKQIHLDIEPYLWYGFGSGGTTTYVSEGNTALLGRPTDLNGDGDTLDTKLYYTLFSQQQVRPGTLLRGKYTTGTNELVVGFQYEFGMLREWRPLFSVNQTTGLPADLWPDFEYETLRRPDGSRVRLQDQNTNTEIIRPFVADTLRLMDDRLTMTFALQRPEMRRFGINYLTLAQRTSGNAIAPDNPQLIQSKWVPSAGAVFKVNDDHQIFASITQTFRGSDNSPLFTAGVNLNALKPESTVNTEIGYRYSGSGFVGSITGFNTNYLNRLQSLFDAGLNTTVNKNIGGVTVKGAEFELGTPSYAGFSGYVSGSYTEATLRNNLYIGVNGTTQPLPTAGKTLTDTPKLIGAVQVHYENDAFFGQVQAKYTDKRYGSLTNDESVPSFVVVDLLAGYRLPQSLTGKTRAEIIASVNNLFDKKYYGGVNFGNNALSYNGIAPNLPSYQVGAPRFMSVKVKVDY